MENLNCMLYNFISLQDLTVLGLEAEDLEFQVLSKPQAPHLLTKPK